MGIHLYTSGAWTDSGRIYRNSLNIFNSVFEQGGIDRNGDLIVSSERIRTFQIVEPNTTYSFSSTRYIRVIFAYDENDEKVGVLYDKGTNLDQSTAFTTQATCTKVGIAIAYNIYATGEIVPSDISNVMLNIGPTAIPYEPRNVVDWYTNTGHGYSSGAWL